MLQDFPGIGVVRLGEQLDTAAYAQQVAVVGARSIVMCRNYGSLAAQVKAALALPGVLYAEAGNEPYWEGVPVASFALEVRNLLAGLSETDRSRVAVACMAGTNFTPQALLSAQPALRDLVKVLACHPYDAYGTGPKGPSASGTPLKSGGQRYVETFNAWKTATGREVDVIVTEVGWCTPPYKPAKTPPAALPLVTEAQQAAYITQAVDDFASHPYVKAVSLYHYLGWDEPKAAAADPTNTVRYNGVVHFDFSRKLGWDALYNAIRAHAPAPPPAPFVPAVGKRTTTTDGDGIIFEIPDDQHVVVALDAGGVRNYPAASLKTTG